jgi:hypothetical protein
MSYDAEYKSLKDLNFALVKRATMVADEICIMRGLVNMHWNKVDTSTYDDNAAFIKDHDRSACEHGICLYHIKLANEALVLKTKEMEVEFDKLNHEVQLGL